MRNLRLVVGYDGTDFNGFQLQGPGTRTVQGELERALGTLEGKPTRVRVAGRTDAGVHAEGQLVSWRDSGRYDCARLLRSVNGMLPADVYVKSIEEAPDDFDSRRDSAGKHYRYRVYTARERHARICRFAHHCYRPLDVARMARAAWQFVGRHDFRAFRAADCERDNTVRTVWRATVSQANDELSIDIEGNAFLKNMVRILAGTLIDIGCGRLPEETIAERFADGDRERAGFTAPALGLTLMRVYLR